MTKLTKINLLLILLPLLSFLGFLDATYLTITHYQKIIPSCSIFEGCEKVLTSQFSQIGPVPTSLLGAIFFLLTMIISILLIQTKSRTVLKLLIFLSFIGVLVSLIFFLIQLLIIKAFCPYCLFSEAVSILLLTISIGLLRFNRL